MPCNSDYMEPTRYEKEIANSATLLVWLQTKLNQPINDIEIKMSNPMNYPQQKDGDYIVAKLCSLVRSLSEEDFESYVYNAYDKTSRELATWWEEHEAADKERIQKELELQKLIEIRKAALSKLTAEEKKALGL